VAGYATIAARAGVLIAGAYMVAYARKVSTMDLEHFDPAEFGGSFPVTAAPILRALDQFRDDLGEPIQVSPAPGAVARTLGPGSSSLHNITKYGQTYAVDVLIPPGHSLRETYRAARAARLFSGLGVYPDWQPRPGLHLDVRHRAPSNPTPEASPSDPARWAGVDDGDGGQRYVAIDEVIGGTLA